MVDHSWDSLAEIIGHKDCQDILLDIGMPVRHRDVLYVRIFSVLYFLF
jgi:NAD+ synthase (glutamine-hydrolysing)